MAEVWFVLTLHVPQSANGHRQSPRKRSTFGRKMLRSSVAAGVLTVVASLGSFTTASAQTADRDPLPLEAQFVTLVNALRVQQGLSPFIVDAEIRDVAMGWTQKMAEAGRISHNPDLGKQVTASWRKLGENVGTGPDVPSIEDAFEASPGHRKNLLDPEFSHISITVVVRGERLYVTQQFRQPEKSVAPAGPAAAAPAPTTPAPSTAPAGPAVPSTSAPSNGVPTELALAVSPGAAGPKLAAIPPIAAAAKAPVANSAKAVAAAKSKAKAAAKAKAKAQAKARAKRNAARRLAAASARRRVRSY